MTKQTTPNVNESGEFLDSYIEDAAKRLLEAQRLLQADLMKSEGNDFRRRSFLSESIQMMEWFVDEYK